MGRRVVLALIVVAIAYGVGWMSDAALNVAIRAAAVLVAGLGAFLVIFVA